MMTKYKMHVAAFAAGIIVASTVTLVWQSLSAPRTITYSDTFDWVLYPEDTRGPIHQYPEIPRDDIYEIPASKVRTAIHNYLNENSCVLLSNDIAQWYTGSYLECPEGKEPYLIRAVYINGGTGDYRIYRSNNDLIVVHLSLGAGSNYHKSALIACIDFAPNAVYVVSRTRE